MTEDHVFVDRENNTTRSKKAMLASWIRFFEMVPHYKNTFDRIQSKGDTAVILGSAYWSEENQHDPVIWTATVRDDLIAEWRIYDDTKENREKFGLT